MPTMLVRGTGGGRHILTFTEGVSYNESADYLYKIVSWISFMTYFLLSSGVPMGGGFNSPPPENLKALQNRATLNPIMKNFKNC